jgi:hypothetical protein
VCSDGIFRYGGAKRRLGLLVTSRKTWFFKLSKLTNWFFFIIKCPF